MTQFGPRCATSYATDAGLSYVSIISSISPRLAGGCATCYAINAGYYIEEMFIFRNLKIQCMVSNSSSVFEAAMFGKTKSGLRLVDANPISQ